MKRRKRLVTLSITVLVFIGVIAGCAQAGATMIHNPGFYESPFDENVYIDLSLEMIPLTASPAVSTILEPSAPGILTKSNSKATIDYSNSADGYVMIRFAERNNTKELRVLITGPSDVRYQYTLDKKGGTEVFPLSDGSGRYTIGVFQQVQGNSYSTALSGTINVELKDEFAPFLRPNQFVNFNKDSKVVAEAAEQTKNSKNLMEDISSIYNFVIKTIKYDRTFAQEVSNGMHKNYVPDVDKVLENKKGICFDYAAVMTAMLRSLGIPTRLVVGYAGTAYHAWIDVYSEETGWINNVIFFDGEQWKLMDPTFASSSNQSDTVMRFIGDGKNYSARFLY